MRVLALITGGKDSILAIDSVKKEGHEVIGLVSFLSKKEDIELRQMVNFEWINALSKALDIPLHEYLISGDEEFIAFEMKAALHSLKFHLPFEGVTFGAVKNSLHRELIDSLCNLLNVKSIAPLWEKSELSEIKNMNNTGYTLITSGIFNEKIDSEYMGKDAIILDGKLSSLYERYESVLFGNHGDFQTFVIDGPVFKKKITFVGTKTFKCGSALLLKVDKVKLTKK